MPQAVILAGGQGHRFWPMTHEKFPKYLMAHDGKNSLLRKTYMRLKKVYSPGDIWVVTAQSHAGLIRQDLPELDVKNLLVEPFGNNTASAIYLSCAAIGKRCGNSQVVSFFPADHLIENLSEFKKTMHQVTRLADKEDSLVMVGIHPTFPATGYGYTECGSTLTGFLGAYRVKRFIEKPPYERALIYLKEGRFLWNSGIFTWRVEVFMDSIKKSAPDFIKHFNGKDLKTIYRKLPGLSIDYALIEKAQNLLVYKTRMDWCDMGSWDRILERASTDKNQNFVQGISYQENSQRSLLLNYHQKPLVMFGVTNLIVVQTQQGTLICKRGQAEEAALLFKKMKK